MAVNLWARWKDLVPADPLLVADVIAAEFGRALVQFPGGSRTWVTGAGTVGTRVFVQGSRIAGEAPALPLVVDEV